MNAVSARHKMLEHAVALYHKAAKYGSPRAQMLLGQRLSTTGRGTAEPIAEKSMFWLKSAAYQRYGDGMHRLRCML